MATDWKTQMTEILKSNGNDQCADCNAKDPDWGVHNIGVFVCINCAGIHRQMGVHISKVRSAKYDEWTDTQLQFIRSKGNSNVNRTLAGAAPIYQMSPANSESSVIREFFIRSKYERKEFLCSEEMKENPAQLDQPDRMRIGVFHRQKTKAKVCLQLLGEYLYYFQSITDSYSVKKANVIQLKTRVSENDTNLILHISDRVSKFDESLQSPTNDNLQIIDWIHAIRRSAHFYQYRNPITAVTPQLIKPKMHFTMNDINDAIILGYASLKTRVSRWNSRKFWILFNGFLYYFKKDWINTQSKNKRKNDETQQTIVDGHISLFKADITADIAGLKHSKIGTVIIATPMANFNIEVSAKTCDTFMREVEKECLRLWPRKNVDFRMATQPYIYMNYMIGIVNNWMRKQHKWEDFTDDIPHDLVLLIQTFIGRKYFDHTA